MAVKGEGVRISYGGSNIDDIISVEFPEPSVNDIQKSGIDTPNKLFRPSVLKDNGEVSYSFYFDDADATHVSVLASTGAAAVAHVITYTGSDGTTSNTWTFDAYTKSAALEGGEEDGEFMCNVTAKVSGAITVA